MTLEEAKIILKDEEYLNCLSDRMTIGEVIQFEKARDTVLKALENDKNAFKNQVEITQEASSLYEKEKEKNIKLEKEIRENYIPKEKVREKIKDLQENNNGDDYNLANVVNILKELLGE